MYGVMSPGVMSPVMPSYGVPLPYGGMGMPLYSPQMSPIIAQPGIVSPYGSTLLFDEQSDEEKPVAKTVVNSRRMNQNVQSGIQQFGQGNMNLQGNVQQVGRRASQVQYQQTGL